MSIEDRLSLILETLSRVETNMNELAERVSTLEKTLVDWQTDELRINKLVVDNREFVSSLAVLEQAIGDAAATARKGVEDAATAQTAAANADAKAIAAQKTASAALPRSGGTMTGHITMKSSSQIRFGSQGEAWIGVHDATSSLHIGGRYGDGTRTVFIAAKRLYRWDENESLIEIAL